MAEGCILRSTIHFLQAVGREEVTAMTRVRHLGLGTTTHSGLAWEWAEGEVILEARVWEGDLQIHLEGLGAVISSNSA